MFILSPTNNNVFFIPLLVVSNSIVVSFLKLSGKNKHNTLSLLLSSYFLRRYLILLNHLEYDFYIKGVVSFFPLIWRYLNTPLEEVY